MLQDSPYIEICVLCVPTSPIYLHLFLLVDVTEGMTTPSAEAVAIVKQRLLAEDNFPKLRALLGFIGRAITIGIDFDQEVLELFRDKRLGVNNLWGAFRKLYKQRYSVSIYSSDNIKAFLYFLLDLQVPLNTLGYHGKS